MLLNSTYSWHTATQLSPLKLSSTKQNDDKAQINLETPHRIKYFYGPPLSSIFAYNVFIKCSVVCSTNIISKLKKLTLTTKLYFKERELENKDYHS